MAALCRQERREGLLADIPFFTNGVTVRVDINSCEEAFHSPENNDSKRLVP